MWSLILACAPGPTGPQALSFAGAPDCVRVDISPSKAPTAFTVEAWVRGEPGAGAEPQPVAWWRGWFELGQDESGLASFVIGQDQGAYWSDTLMDGVVHHVAGTYDGGTGIAYLYVDGALAGSVGSAFLMDSAGDTLHLGCSDDGAYGFTGIVDELRVSSAVRYAEESFTLPDAPFEKDGDTLALFHLDEGEGEETASEAGGLTGTITGATWVEFTFRDGT
jgi:hypothetical protein